MSILPYKKIYFVGIKGVGMTSLAIIAKQAGYEVSGSDVQDVFITDSVLAKNGIAPDVGFQTETVSMFIEENIKKTLVISTAAHGGFENPQVMWAKGKNVDILSFGQALGMFQYGTLLNRQDVQGISVAGSHGKTTTTAMLATALSFMKQDPSYVIGTSTGGALGDAGHLGKGKYFVVESDEYVSDLTFDRTPKFLYQHPFAAIITNIDFDHPDVFPDLNSVYDAFKTFVKNIQQQGVLVILGDDPKNKDIIKNVSDGVHTVTFGLDNSNRYVAKNITHTQTGVAFTVVCDNKELGTVTLSVIGLHNVLNSLSVVALLHTLGYEFAEIALGLGKFTGTKRRIEIKGVTKQGVQIIDDYAHHPTEISATLTALHDAYPTKKIVCIFQPHTLSRTQHLITEFSRAFVHIDRLLLLPIFSSAREGKVDINEQNRLYDQILKNTPGEYKENIQDVIEYCIQNYTSDDYLIVTMGAGDVYKIGEQLIKL